MDDIVDRLNGRYSVGPHLPNGDPEYGWRQFQATPINKEAANIILALRAALTALVVRCDCECDDCRDCYRAAAVALAMGQAQMRKDTFMAQTEAP